MSREKYEGNRETGSATDEKPVVELVEENRESIAPEFRSEPDKLTESDALLKPFRKIVPDEGELQHILELDANPQVQLKENYRITAAHSLGFFKTMIAVSMYVLANSLLVRQHAESIPLAIAVIIGATAFRTFHAHRKARAETRTKYILTADAIHASGPDPKSKWKLLISDIERATLISGVGNMKSLVLSTAHETFVLNGLEGPERLFLMLPGEVRSDSSALENELQEIADSIHECKDAEEVAQMRDAKQLRKSVKEALQSEFPDARVLKPDFTRMKEGAIATLVIAILAVVASCFGYREFALPFLPIILLGFLSELMPFLRTADSLYIFTPAALFELDRKRGIVNTIALNRVSIQKPFGGFDSLYIDEQLHVPTRIDKADAAFMKRWIQKYPRSR